MPPEQNVPSSHASALEKKREVTLAQDEPIGRENIGVQEEPSWPLGAHVRPPRQAMTVGEMMGR